MSSTASTPSSQPKKPKGILKKPTTSTTASTATTPVPISPFPIEEHKPATPKPGAREAAVQQARIIQQQRALEDEIQDCIIELSRLPLATSGSGSAFSSSNPSPDDADAFRRLVRLFQPGDYEDMIEERNTLDKCGYALCPRPRVRLGPGGEYKLVNWGKADFGIVPRKELERWCSRECARRAMYVKVQLGETAAWERAGLASIRIDLLDEPKQAKEEEDDPARRLERELENVERKAAQDAKDLALERGDSVDKPTTRKIKLTIREKSVKMAAQEPSLDADGENHLVLDGYKTKFNREAEQKGKEDEDDNMKE
ncbi:uncharacterized protein F4812DRAFT_279556 [Daldinia caldariorum]|uniref:uncharacterized protein n=1 Tax=Daldinia caldariorum TaxID=326644 RepID=UPI0020084CB5|nr:uncharacterized protein F4812DRAFT_279556 [Daldinia caldariorum]KAI1470800.1 hypothetical protein F4812DRAFT_279556 [Daldinia caldariorum]